VFGNVGKNCLVCLICFPLALESRIAPIIWGLLGKKYIDRVCSTDKLSNKLCVDVIFLRRAGEGANKVCGREETTQS